MAINKDDVEKILVGAVGIGIVSAVVGLTKLIDSKADVEDTFDESYEEIDNENELDDEADEYISEMGFAEDKISRESNSVQNEIQESQFLSENDDFQQQNMENDYEAVQSEFESKSNIHHTEYIYLDFTQNLKSGSRNWNDVYQESIEDQFEKIQRKLAMCGKNNGMDIGKFVNLCFPMIKSAYYVSLPGFERKIETSMQYQGAECIYNMVLRPAKTAIISSVIPEQFDVILVGDLVFRNKLISFVVKGLDLIDKNVEKFGELRIECAAACAIRKNSKNLPDYGIEGRELYKPFLTRDMVLLLCEKIYPIENPEKAIGIFEKWGKYVDFRSYFLGIQSQRNEQIAGVDFIRAYAISKSVYKKNEAVYSEYLLDNNKNFIQRDQVLLNEANEDAVEVPLIKVEVIRNLAEISRAMSRNKKISEFERELRRFTRMQVALSATNPNRRGNYDSLNEIVYLGDRVAFEAENIFPDCEDIIQFYDSSIGKAKNQIDEKYKEIIRSTMEVYRKKENENLENKSKKAVEEYCDLLDKNLETDVLNNVDKNLEKKYRLMVDKIKAKHEKQRKHIEKMYKNKSGIELEGYEEEKEKNEIKEVQEIEAIPLATWYRERNEKLKNDFENSQKAQNEKELNYLCSEKEKLLNLELADIIAEEKKEYEIQYEEKKQEEIRKKREKLTERHFYIYFKAEDIDYSHWKEGKISGFQYLIYDNRAEKAKIDRQRKTLESFYKGYVKNPFLASYLFAPDTLGKAESEIGEIEWFGSRLNDRQKEAVRKALSSNSVFLLQGPPGTGKTEVIAEITAQYVRQGKKVLVSSETHKAIDNVFDRLPKIPEIRPLRLIPSLTNKDTEYSPEKLVDNLYQSIATRLDKRIQQYENFAEMKSNFGEKMQELRYQYNQLSDLEIECQKIRARKKTLQEKIETIDVSVEQSRSIKLPLEEELDQYHTVLLCAERGSFWEDIDKADILSEIGKLLYELLSKYDFFYDLDPEEIQRIHQISLEQIRNDFKIFEENSASMSVEQEKASIRSKLRRLIDPDTYDVMEGKREEYEKLRKQLIALANAKEIKNEVNYTSLSVAAIIPADKLSDSSKRSQIIREFADIKEKMARCLDGEKEKINQSIKELEEKIEQSDYKIASLKKEKSQVQSEIEKLNDDNAYASYRHKQQTLRKAIVEFFSDFDIRDEYSADNYGAAIDIISRRWKEIEKNQEILQQENQLKIPMYKAIRNYLGNEEILEEDRISYTKKLFENANVFGMTCTSRERFKESSMKSLREYKLGDINIRNVGIDVVIIDEVSKSSFLDLLIPILYGKTVILVGDHRQLPPLYDLKHMRKEDFDGLDPEIIDYDLNREYQKLYETCFFKELFECVPDAYKIMLDKQYRCHSDIMDVFNHFYSTNGKGLSVGLSNQNDLKNHDLQVKYKGVTLIEPHNHIYFVNCTEYESRLDKDSSSIVNRQEATVVCQLLKLMNEEYGRMLESGIIRRDSKKDERKSVGVICTYRDQARYIKTNLKGMRFNNFSQKREERLIINTVDDFQGDERDIIIVSMVRNPLGERYSTDFIDQFERINVALSRARCMLIIVGAQEFLSRSSIELPDINGHRDLDRHSFPVYREIIRTIQAKGKILQASDVIGEVTHYGK